MSDLKLALALLDDPKVPGGKVGHVRVVPEGTPNSVEGVCAGTGEKVVYSPDPLYDVLAVAVDEEAARVAGWQHRPQTTVAVVEGESETETEVVAETVAAPEVEVPAPPKKKEKVERIPPKPCPECGGRKIGRGYSHAEGCSLRVVKKVSDKPKEVCPHCGGPKRGRGFSHKPDCSR